MIEGKYYDFKIKHFDKTHFQIIQYDTPHKYDYKKKENNLETDQANADSLNDTIRNIKKSIETSRNRAKNKIYDLARCNDFDYFVTLTFNPEKVDSFNYDACSEKLSKWLNNLKSRYSPDLRYIVVPELHKSGRYHFHGLFGNIGNLQLVDSERRTPNGLPIYNLGDFHLGFTTATLITDKNRVSTYIGKYITKDLSGHIKGKKHYWASRNLNTPDEEILTAVAMIARGFDMDYIKENAVYEKMVNYTVCGVETSVRYYEIDLNNK